MKIHSKLSLIALLISAIFSVETNAQNLGSTAPDFTLNKLDGGSFTLSAQGEKVVFIFFFGNSCPHCLANGPNTQTDIYELYKDYPDFVAVGVDTWNGNAAAVQSYKSTTGIEYPLLLNGSAVESSYNTTYDRIVIVDQQGVIKYKSTTVADKATTEEASSIITALLGVTTGIGEQEANSRQFLLAPNIIHNELRIINPFKQAQQVKIEVIDMTGKVVYVKNKIELNSDIYIDASTLSPGFFTVVVGAKNDYKIAKFVKAN